MVNEKVRCHFCQQVIPFNVNTGDMVKFEGIGEDKYYCKNCLAILYKAKLTSDETFKN